MSVTCQSISPDGGSIRRFRCELHQGHEGDHECATPTDPIGVITWSSPVSKVFTEISVVMDERVAREFVEQGVRYAESAEAIYAAIKAALPRKCRFDVGDIVQVHGQGMCEVRPRWFESITSDRSYLTDSRTVLVCKAENREDR